MKYNKFELKKTKEKKILKKVKKNWVTVSLSFFGMIFAGIVVNNDNVAYASTNNINNYNNDNPDQNNKDSTDQSASLTSNSVNLNGNYVASATSNDSSSASSTSLATSNNSSSVSSASTSASNDSSSASSTSLATTNDSSSASSTSTVASNDSSASSTSAVASNDSSSASTLSSAASNGSSNVTSTSLATNLDSKPTFTYNSSNDEITMKNGTLNNSTADVLSSYISSNSENTDRDIFVGHKVLSNFKKLDFENVSIGDGTTDMSNVFAEGSVYNQFDNIDLSGVTGWNKVTNMSDMFNGNDANIILGKNFDTSNVTNMSGMFANTGLTSIDLGNKFDTSTGLTSIDLGNKFDTSKVTDMSRMFANTRLTSIDLGANFNTSNVTNMNSMFFSSQFKSINLGSNFNTQNVTDMGYMFDNIEGDSININLGPNFDTSKVTNMDRMFSSNIPNLDLGDKFDTSNVINMNEMFPSDALKTLDLGAHFNVSKAFTSFNFFPSSLDTIKTESNIDLSNMFNSTYGYHDQDQLSNWWNDDKNRFSLDGNTFLAGTNKSFGEKINESKHFSTNDGSGINDIDDFVLLLNSGGNSSLSNLDEADWAKNMDTMGASWLPQMKELMNQGDYFVIPQSNIDQANTLFNNYLQNHKSSYDYGVYGNTYDIANTVKNNVYYSENNQLYLGDPDYGVNSNYKPTDSLRLSDIKVQSTLCYTTNTFSPLTNKRLTGRGFDGSQSLEPYSNHYNAPIYYLNLEDLTHPVTDNNGNSLYVTFPLDYMIYLHPQVYDKNGNKIIDDLTSSYTSESNSNAASDGKSSAASSNSNAESSAASSNSNAGSSSSSSNSNAESSAASSNSNAGSSSSGSNSNADSSAESFNSDTNINDGNSGINSNNTIDTESSTGISDYNDSQSSYTNGFTPFSNSDNSSSDSTSSSDSNSSSNALNNSSSSAVNRKSNSTKTSKSSNSSTKTSNTKKKNTHTKKSSNKSKHVIPSKDLHKWTGSWGIDKIHLRLTKHYAYLSDGVSSKTKEQKYKYKYIKKGHYYILPVDGNGESNVLSFNNNQLYLRYDSKIIHMHK